MLKELISKYQISVIGGNLKVNGKVTNEDRNTIVENKQQIITIIEEEKEARRIERMTRKYSNPEEKVIIRKKYDGTIIVENRADQILGIESIDLETLKEFAKSYDDGTTTYVLTVAELKALAAEKEEVETVVEKSETEKEIERLATVAKETGKPHIISENTGWDPAKGIPVIDYKMVNEKGEVYFYTKDLEN